MSIRENLEAVRERVSRAAESAGRDPSNITIVAITKTHPPETVDEAVREGLVDVGENKVQEFLAKADRVTEKCRWHFVGHLQRNKVKKVVGRVQLIHSVDSPRLAREIARAGEAAGVESDALIQVNTSGEESKFGVSPDDALKLCEEAASLEGIKIKGLMTMAPWVDDSSIISAAFSALRRLAERIESEGIEGISMKELSMGMTDDFEVAVKEGSTILRLGRVLFGPRQG